MDDSRRLRHSRGAVMFINLIACLLIVAVAAATTGLIHIGTSDDRALAAADATAHAAAGYLAADPNRVVLSIDAQGDHADCAVGYPGDPIAAADDEQCNPLVNQVRDVADRNGATLVSFRIGPDTRDMLLQSGPGRLVVLVTTAVPRRIPGTEGYCGGRNPANSPLCFATAVSSAEEAG